jgi:hypothetical protein
MQVDHYYPHHLTDYYDKNHGIITGDLLNLMPSCRSCNHYKRGDTPEEFRIKMKTIRERLLKSYIAKVAVNFSIISVSPFDGLFYFEKNRSFGIIYPDDINNGV